MPGYDKGGKADGKGRLWDTEKGRFYEAEAER
jgi:hypothetical protein